MFDWEALLIKPNDSLEHAINILNKEGCRIVLVTDKHKNIKYFTTTALVFISRSLCA